MYNTFYTNIYAQPLCVNTKNADKPHPTPIHPPTHPSVVIYCFIRSRAGIILTLAGDVVRPTPNNPPEWVTCHQTLIIRVAHAQLIACSHPSPTHHSKDGGSICPPAARIALIVIIDHRLASFNHLPLVSSSKTKKKNK